jgi:geranylgeranyl diphosphate synthase type II
MTTARDDIATFAEYLERQRAAIDAALARTLPRTPACPELLHEALEYSLQAGGKRLRPVLTMAAADAVVAAGDADGAATAADALPAACALELIHTYSLIHDDLPAMDDDTMRRGRPTLHVVYGDGIAILAGDALLTEAFALLAREPRSDLRPDLAHRKLRVLEVIARAAGATGMVGGQVVDLESAGDTEIPGRPPRGMDRDGLPAMHAMKTGALIRAAAVAGGIMAGGTDAQIAALDAYAAELGLVFQIVDDILDVEGASATLGKTAGKDAAAGKPSYPALFGLDESRALADRGIARARAALLSAGLTANHLMAIAEWVVGRDR